MSDDYMQPSTKAMVEALRKREANRPLTRKLLDPFFAKTPVQERGIVGNLYGLATDADDDQFDASVTQMNVANDYQAALTPAIKKLPIRPVASDEAYRHARAAVPSALIPQKR